MKNTYKNYEKYWREWNVLQTPKVDFYGLGNNGWDVMDVNTAEPQTIAKKGDTVIRVKYYDKAAGVKELSVSSLHDVVWKKSFDFILKPMCSDIEKLLRTAGVSDWRKYCTFC